eukprot:COSAG02_NODE_5532_length_4250_cov_108.522525_5_plen_601_part_00
MVMRARTHRDSPARPSESRPFARAWPLAGAAAATATARRHAHGRRRACRMQLHEIARRYVDRPTMRVATGIRLLQAALGLALATAKYTECQGENHIKAGDCNSPNAPCKPGTGYTNVHKTDSLAACEAKCDAALPKGNCAGVTWHDASAGEWAHTCVLETADAWAGTALRQGGHISACNGLAPCKCSSGPPGPPSPPKIDPAGCIVKRAALAYSQKALSPPRHADLISNALDFTGCPPATELRSTEAVASTAQPPRAWMTDGESNFYVDAGKGSDSATGTSAASAFKTLHKAQIAARGVAGATVHLLPGATHYLTETLTLTPEDSHVSWVGAAASAPPSPTPSNDVVVSGAVSLSAACMGKWKQAGGHTGSAAAYTCQLPAGTQFDSLFLNGLRQQKARFPNGDPLAVKDGYEAGCKAVDWFDISGIKEYPTNLQMVSKSGAHISQGSVFPPDANRTVVIADRTAPREGETTGNNPSYYNTRFNETYNHPFWATTAPSAIKLSKAIGARSAKWKSPKGAVVRMLHPAGWGGWAFGESLDARQKGPCSARNICFGWITWTNYNPSCFCECHRSQVGTKRGDEFYKGWISGGTRQQRMWGDV